MARPAMRGPNSNWSLSQVATEAGITPRTARTLVTNDYLDPGTLTIADVVIAKVAAALLEAPRPSGLPRTASADQTRARNQQALNLARGALTDPQVTREAILAVQPHETSLCTNAYMVMGLLGNLRSAPALLLPLGDWVLDIRTTLNDSLARTGIAS